MNFKVFLLLFISLTSYAKILDVPRVEQETKVWCWLASSEMVEKYYGACSVDKDPDIQCSMIRYMAFSGYVDPNCAFDCKSCLYPAGTIDNLVIPIDYYTKDASKNCGVALKSHIEHVEASVSRLKHEIDHNRPIMAGINPSLRGCTSNEAEHLVVIVGYKGKGNNPVLRVNDPYDYTKVNPYAMTDAKMVKNGVYDISYKNLLQKFCWQSTIYVRKVK